MRVSSGLLRTETDLASPDEPSDGGYDDGGCAEASVEVGVMKLARLQALVAVVPVVAFTAHEARTVVDTVTLVGAYFSGHVARRSLILAQKRRRRHVRLGLPEVVTARARVELRRQNERLQSSQASERIVGDAARSKVRILV